MVGFHEKTPDEVKGLVGVGEVRITLAPRERKRDVAFWR
jgi:hypothetical protein